MLYKSYLAAYEAALGRAARALNSARFAADGSGRSGEANDCAMLHSEVTRLLVDSANAARRPMFGQLGFDDCDTDGHAAPRDVFNSSPAT